MPLKSSDRLTIEEVIGAIHPVQNVGSAPMRTPIGPVTSDSRDVVPGSLFVALPGERVDGADFVAEAFRKGAAAAIVSEAGAAKEDIELRNRLAIVYGARGDYARAEKLFREALTLDPDDAKAIDGLGRAQATAAGDADIADDADDTALAADWLALLHAQAVDFTLAWRRLADAAAGHEAPLRAMFAQPAALQAWLGRWQAREKGLQ